MTDGAGPATYAGSAVGIALATLLPDPRGSTAAELLEAAAAAEEAGFASLTAWPDQVTDRDAWRGRVAVVETAVGYTRGATPELAEQAESLVDLAVDLGATMVAACTLRPRVEDLDAAAEGLAVLGAVAQRAGLTVCLEFLPWTGIGSLQTAWYVAEATGLDNVGVVLDTWHFHRQAGGPDHAVLESIPGSRIPYVQLCDATPQPDEDLMVEAMTNRLLPGDGVVDLDRIGRSLAVIGAEPLYVVETFNTDLAARGPRSAATAVRRSLDQLARRELDE